MNIVGTSTYRFSGRFAIVPKFASLLVSLAARVWMIGSPLLFSVTGCQSVLLAGDSRLAGTWAIVEGKEVLASLQLREIPRESDIQVDPSRQTPTAVIRPDGSFDLTHSIFGASGPGIAQLRKVGDQFTPRNDAKGERVYYYVEQSRYTPNSSFMVMSMRHSDETTETLSLSATLLTSGDVAYEETFRGREHKRSVKATLNRFQGKLPWEDEEAR